MEHKGDTAELEDILKQIDRNNYNRAAMQEAMRKALVLIIKHLLR